MLKYKVAFTISAESLFAILAKTLPVDDLEVREIVDETKLHHLSEQQAARLEQSKLARSHRRYTKRKSAHLFNPNGGINKILLDSLITGPRTVIDIRPLLVEGGYSPNSAGSRLQKLQQRGLVIQHGNGLWSLPGTTIQEQHNAPA